MRGVWVIVGLLAAGLAGANAWAQSAPSAQQRAQDMLKTCFECHGEGGVSRLPTRPTIAGQKADYLTRQLLAFRNAAHTQPIDTDTDADSNPKTKALTRTDPIMAHMLDGLDGQTIGYVANAVSQLSCRGKASNKVTPAPTVPKAVTRCAACHGLDGISRQAGTPNLAGQQPAYLRRQLLLIRETAYGAKPRENESWRSHPIMEREAARISIQDVDALAKYYAALDCRGPQ